MTEQYQKPWLTVPRVLFWILVGIFLILQWRLWVVEGMPEIWRLTKSVERQEQENHLAVERNKRLQAEVKNLKEGLDAVEERARTQLGMVKEGETFFLIIDNKSRKER